MIQQNPSSHRETPGKSIRILVVDDHTLFRQGLRRLFESEEGFTIIGEAADGEEDLIIHKGKMDLYFCCT